VRLVLDTSVLVAALRSPEGPSRVLLNQGLAGAFDWLISVPLCLEYETVLRRPEQLRATGLSAAEVDVLIDRILRGAIRVVLERSFEMTLPDEDDEHVLALALNGAADGVVTYNVRHFAALPVSFGINLYSPAQALYRLGGKHV
jgi:predicted nucleic acid-binding protein